MIKGAKVSLRLIEEKDIEVLYRYLCDIANRGFYFPGTVRSMTELRTRFVRDGFWSPRRGTMVIVDRGGRVVGWILFFIPHPESDAYEAAYVIFDERSRNRGYATEALSLFVRFLFRTTPAHRIELNIATDNLPSARVAEKCGFVCEGISRAVWFSTALGRRLDGARYAILRTEVDYSSWNPAGPGRTRPKSRQAR
jgi:[ribosomal protein S5]-alanine N-acetyltransferase